MSRSCYYVAGVILVALFFCVSARAENLSPVDDLQQEIEELFEITCPAEQLICYQCPSVEQLQDPDFKWNKEKCKRRQCTVIVDHFKHDISFCWGKCAYKGEHCQGPIFEVGIEPGGRCTCKR